MSLRHHDRGALSTFLAVIALALLMATGLVVDGGRKISALREASHLAANAARAGAQAVDLDTLRTTGEIHLVSEQAVARADQYLAGLGHSGQTTATGSALTVTVTLTITPVLLPIGQITVSATETATAVSEEPG